MDGQRSWKDPKHRKKSETIPNGGVYPYQLDQPSILRSISNSSSREPMCPKRKTPKCKRRGCWDFRAYNVSEKFDCIPRVYGFFWLGWCLKMTIACTQRSGSGNIRLIPQVPRPTKAMVQLLQIPQWLESTISQFSVQT